MSDLECPYCGADNEVNHDDGFGYEEDRRHEMECSKCDKKFIFTTSISYDYSPEKADCLNNGGAHVLEMSATYPRRCSNMQCRDCDYKRKPTPEEFAAAGISTETCQWPDEEAPNNIDDTPLCRRDATKLLTFKGAQKGVPTCEDCAKRRAGEGIDVTDIKGAE